VLHDLVQRVPRPKSPLPIVFIGAGGIVRDAHLPAYRAAGFPVAGIHDIDLAKAKRMARTFAIGRVFDTLDEAASVRDVVFDVAVPGDQILPVLKKLPDGAAILVQKPMGRDLPEARRILALCRSKHLLAAINFQLRFSPNMMALADVFVRVNTYTPWNLWSFLEGIPRLEILYHSIHYLDLLRSLLGEPKSVHCVAVPDPALPRHADVRSSILLHYPGALRVALYTHHSHAFGPSHAASELKIEGTKGAAVARMGVNLDYPTGLPDTLEIAAPGGTWRPVRLRGSWFPDAFEGTMASLQRKLSGESEQLPTSVRDAVKTMALVEACYRSASREGVRPAKA
jgi:predicted dehydrogenase